MILMIVVFRWLNQERCPGVHHFCEGRKFCGLSDGRRKPSDVDHLPGAGPAAVRRRDRFGALLHEE